MSVLLGARTLAAVRSKIDEGYAYHGRVHRLLELWDRLDRHGAAGGGQLVRSSALRLDDMDDQRISSIIGLDKMAIPFAQAEVALFFADPGHVEAAVPGEGLDAAVGRAIARSLAYGGDAAIWASTRDDDLVEQSGAVAEVNPEPLLDARWRRRRVIYENFLPAGAVWVTGQDAGRMTFYPTDDGHLVQVDVRLEGDVRVLEASVRLEVSRLTRAALTRIDIGRRP